MAAAPVVEDMRGVDPVGYIRAVGLRPEDSYGFLPIDLNEGTSYFFLYREQPEYEERRPALPGATEIKNYGMFEIDSGAPQSMEMDQLPEFMQNKLGGVIEDAQQMQQQWAGQGIPGGPDEDEATRIKRLDVLRESGAINKKEYDDLVSEIKGGSAGSLPGGAEAAPAAKDAPPIVSHRLYPGMRMRSSTRQLNHFLPKYREQLGLCSEDVYGVVPMRTRTSSSGESSETEWDDFWIIYRDRPEYEAGREAWAKEMNKKGKWPAAEVTPGVAEPGTKAFDGAKVEVEKDRWPREKLVMRKQGTDLGDDLRKRIGKWGYEPEDSLGFCPDFDNSAIYFAWRKA